MFDFQDLFQWDRFITPTIIKIFYWLAIVLSVDQIMQRMLTRSR